MRGGPGLLTHITATEHPRAAGLHPERDGFRGRRPEHPRECGADQAFTFAGPPSVGIPPRVRGGHFATCCFCMGSASRFRPRHESDSAPVALRARAGQRGQRLGQEDRDDMKRAPQVRADRQLALERPQRLGHMTGASWFAALARHAREHGGGELRAWLSEQELTPASTCTVPPGTTGPRRTRTGWASGPKVAGTSASCWNTTPAASICPSCPASSASRSVPAAAIRASASARTLATAVSRSVSAAGRPPLGFGGGRVGRCSIRSRSSVPSAVIRSASARSERSSSAPVILAMVTGLCVVGRADHGAVLLGG